MANYIGAVLSSYTVSSLMSNLPRPDWMANASAFRSGASLQDSDFATIASDYKALQTRKYDELSSSYSYLNDVTSPDYATESQTSTDKAEAKPDEKQINLSPNQMAVRYGKFATESHMLDMLV